MAIQYPLDGHLFDSLTDRLDEIEKHFAADVIFFYGEIHPSLVRLFTLLKKWLVEYKFRTWDVHGTNPHKLGQPVTQDEKRERAEEVARCLSNQKLWHSHGRNIGVNALRDIVKLKIEDYSGDDHVRSLIRSYNDLITDYIRQKGFPVFLHSRES